MHGKERFTAINQDSGNKRKVMNIYFGKLHAGDIYMTVVVNNDLGLSCKYKDHFEIQCLRL